MNDEASGNYSYWAGKNFELQEKEPGIPGDKAAYGLDGCGELVFDSMT